MGVRMTMNLVQRLSVQRAVWACIGSLRCVVGRCLALASGYFRASNSAQPAIRELVSLRKSCFGIPMEIRSLGLGRRFSKIFSSKIQIFEQGFLDSVTRTWRWTSLESPTRAYVG